MTEQTTSHRIERRAFVAELLRNAPQALVVSGLGSPSYDVYAAGDRDGNFYLWGAMGGAASVGLGLALAQPERPVIVVTGDGEMLMGLGSLATIGVKQPRNLSIVVLDNGHYGETGMQRSHAGLGMDLVAVAKGCGIRNAMSIERDAQRASLEAGIQALDGPCFARVAIRTEEVPRALPPRDGAYVKNRFRAALSLPPF